MGVGVDALREVGLVQRACRGSLGYLCQKVFGYRDWDKIHDDLERFLIRPSRRKMILIPRGHLKTAIITKAWSIQQVLRNPNIRILIANQVWDKAREMLYEIKQRLGQGELPGIFGNFISERWNLNEIVDAHRTEALSSPTIGTTGVEAEMTSTHFDGIILDDLQGLQNSQTKEQRDKVKRFYRSMIDLLEPGGWMMVVGTRWHQDDLYSDIFENEGDFYDVTVRKVIEDGRIIFPNKFSLKWDAARKDWVKSGNDTCFEYVDHLKKVKGWEFYSQYMNEPTSDENAAFKLEYFQYFGKRPDGLYVGMTIDPAITLKEESDFTTVVVAGMNAERQIFVLDYVRGHWTPAETIDNVFQKADQWRPLSVGLETIGFQRTFKYSFDEEMRRRGKYFAITELGQISKTSKEYRIKALEPYYRSKQVWHAQWMENGDLEKELLDFPRSKKDDLSDALSMQLRILSQGSQSRTEDMNPMSWEARARTARQFRTGNTNFYDQW